MCKKPRESVKNPVDVQKMSWGNMQNRGILSPTNSPHVMAELLDDFPQNNIVHRSATDTYLLNVYEIRKPRKTNWQ